MFKTYIRPLVESNTPIWNPFNLGDIKIIENVQRKFTKRLPGMRNLSYNERLSQLENQRNLEKEVQSMNNSTY